MPRESSKDFYDDKWLLGEKWRVPLSVLDITHIRAQGPGGQNVNKVSTAIALKVAISDLTISEEAKARLASTADSRISAEGKISIKAQSFRTQERNYRDALLRLKEMIDKSFIRPKKRRATKPTRASVKRRLESKAKRSAVKRDRQRKDW